MKNLKFGILSAVLLFGLTGCGTETLICELEDESVGTAKLEVEFKDDEMTSYKMSTEMDLGMEIPEEEVSTFCEEFTEVDAIKCEAKADGTKLSLELDIDTTDLSEDERKELDIEGDTLEDFKKSMEDEGFKCE